jgi:hypothetical protein
MITPEEIKAKFTSLVACLGCYGIPNAGCANKEGCAATPMYQQLFNLALDAKGLPVAKDKAVYRLAVVMKAELPENPYRRHPEKLYHDELISGDGYQEALDDLKDQGWVQEVK